jgi:hypothetical protein
MLDQGPDLGFLTVVPALNLCQWVVALPLFTNPTLNSVIRKHLFDAFAHVGAVGMQILPPIRILQQFSQRHTVVHIGRGHLVFGYQYFAGIRFHMVLVAKVFLAVLGQPAGIGILVAAFVLIPFGRNHSGLDPLVLLAGVALAWNLHNRGIDDRSGLGKNPLGFEFGREHFEEFTLEPLLRQGLAESPEACVVGDGLSDVKPEKAGERKPIRDLKLQLLVAEVEKSLNNQGLEHENHIQRLAPSGAFALCLPQGFGQKSTKNLEINMFAEFLQGISQAAQSGKTLALIEKGRLVEFHANVSQHLACQ